VSFIGIPIADDKFALQLWRLDATSALMPAPEDVKDRTDTVTKRIQELWAAMVDNRRELFLPCAVRIRAAVGDLTAIFPQAVMTIYTQYKFLLTKICAGRPRRCCPQCSSAADAAFWALAG